MSRDKIEGLHYPSPVLTWILPFPVLAQTLFRYSPGFYPCSVLAQILLFSGSRLDTTFLSALLDHFSVLFQILPFSCTRQNSTPFQYSLGFYAFPIVLRIIFRYSLRFYPSPVLARILPFFGNRPDSTLLQYSPRFYLPFPVLAQTLFRYSSGFYPSWVLTQILPFSASHLESTFPSAFSDHFLVLAGILPFSETRPDSTLFQYSLGFYAFSILL